MNNDQPAFPVTGFETRHGQGMQAVYHSGLSLRDYFAAKAMQGIIGTERAQEFVDNHGKEMGYEPGDWGTLFIHSEFLAEEAYMIADQMLRAREKK